MRYNLAGLRRLSHAHHLGQNKNLSITINNKNKLSGEWAEFIFQ